MLKEPAPQTLVIAVNNMSLPHEVEGENKLNINFFPQKNHPISWSDSDVDKLLDFLNENFSDYREKKTDFYNKAAVLFEGISPMQIKNKFKKLFLRYRAILNEASQVGTEYYTPWRYYEKIDRILRSHFGPDDFSQTMATEVGLGDPLSPPTPAQQQCFSTNVAPTKSPLSSSFSGPVGSGDTREKVMAFFNAGRRSADVFVWTHAEIQRLLDCLEKYFDLYSRKKTDFYEKAAQLLPGVTSLQINNKLKKMVRRYHDIRSNTIPSSNGAATWVYFKQLDRIFRSNHDGGVSESDSNGSNVDLNNQEDGGVSSTALTTKPLHMFDSSNNNFSLFHHFPQNNVAPLTERPSFNQIPPVPSPLDLEASQPSAYNDSHAPKRARFEEQPMHTSESTNSFDLEEILRHSHSEIRSQILAIRAREVQVKEKALEIDREIRLKQLEFDREIRLMELELDKEIRLKDLEYKYLQRR